MLRNGVNNPFRVEESIRLCPGYAPRASRTPVFENRTPLAYKNRIMILTFWDRR
jgi:hypothetical protein